MRCSPPHYVARPLADSLDAPVGGLPALSAILPVCAPDAHTLPIMPIIYTTLFRL